LNIQKNQKRRKISRGRGEFFSGKILKEKNQRREFLNGRGEEKKTLKKNLGG